MSIPPLTYTGPEIGRVAGFIARAMPLLDGEEFEVADLMLERALSCWPEPMDPELAAEIEVLRRPPVERFWHKLRETFPPGHRFSLAWAGLSGGVTMSQAIGHLAELRNRTPGVRADADGYWIEESAP